MSFDTEINLSSSMDFNKNSIEETSSNFKYDKKDFFSENIQRFGNFSAEYEVDMIDCQPLYHAIMEWCLRKTPSNLETPLTIDDTDKIEEPELVNVIMAFYKNCSHELKPKVLQDIIMLIKWNQTNCSVFLESQEFTFWLIDVLLHQQTLFFGPEAKNNGTVSNLIYSIIFSFRSWILEQKYSQYYSDMLFVITQ